MEEDIKYFQMFLEGQYSIVRFNIRISAEIFVERKKRLAEP